MKIAQFQEEALLIAKRLMMTISDINKTVEVLRRLLHTDEVEFSEWGVHNGKIYVTFNSDVEIEHVPDGEQYVARALRAMFPNCLIKGTTVEIESSELL